MAHLAFQDQVFSDPVIVDADVDAANLALVVGAQGSEGAEFWEGEAASIDSDSCLDCGVCQEFCRFDAISYSVESGFQVDPLGCEGCAACYYQCPTEAIAMFPRLSGHWFRSTSRLGTLLHASLLPTQESSGKLVSLIKEQARKGFRDEAGGGRRDERLLIVDGPPGIACPAIAAVSGADLVLIVTEPTMAGLYDLNRADQMAAHFRVPRLVCINKADIHPDGANRIEAHCRERGIEVLGRIPFDEAVTEAMIAGEAVTEYSPGSPASLGIIALWNGVKAALQPV
jgi:MinD superfamily P-loop ATPase